ncbi:mitochondrial import inner membrane translocase subunit TIM50-like [Mizuhopecten yessoensis]|uniref:Mitochondrial import inner membrane translocase subunit TIM50 n=1 Tax=Mizuhopecten yessoensis TaxID=6573 RepID=A0A210PXK4_MIZYE|nr:mitochondrial import inner membrane translocase subunit TIM50-like [Mizuhopecten yessoensis]OWF41211.1 Mitochondrial import inner membrane translocase subunit TIM50 [Mizuhopecten yessoensis]
MAAFMGSGMRSVMKSKFVVKKLLCQYGTVSTLQPCIGISFCNFTVMQSTPLCKYMSTGIGSRNFIPMTEKCLLASDVKPKSVRQKSDTILHDSSTGQESSNQKEDEKTGKKEWYQTSTFKAIAAITMSSLSFGGLAYIMHIQGEPARNESGSIVEDEFTGKWNANFSRAIQRYINPSREQLLPEPLQAPYYQPPYTLVMEITGVLIHPEWTYETGWRFKKRPGVDYFFSKVCPPLFEVVIFTSEGGMNADPLVNNLDPHGAVMYRLYRDSTKYVNGHHVKDLSYLNRDLSKVIVVDCNEKSFQFHIRNGLKLKKWTGDDEDKTLIDLANFLQVVGSSGVEDVRTVMEYYSKFDDPMEAFKENQKKLEGEKQRRLAMATSQDPKKSWFWRK